ncbi:hypothetical protein [Cohnella mopanensis]|uniref:hypothetical protein n=1 Tax=Cohnella mopanensis TaxID=2911966 RepID=UPI001EF90A40|nr:hypothetical protein [Cohnella mopanensis]
MGVNVGLAASQASAMNQYSTTLRDINNSLKQYRANLNLAWQSDEMVFVNQAIDRLTNEIVLLSKELESLGSDIVSVANEIYREEEAARQAAAAAAAARAAMNFKPNW